MTVYGGLRLAPSYTGLVGRGRVGASSTPFSLNVLNRINLFWGLVHVFHDYRDFAHLQVLVRQMLKVECRVQLRHSSWVSGPRLVQVRGRIPGAARPEGVQQGWGAAVEGHGGPRARQPQGVSNGQGPA